MQESTNTQDPTILADAIRFAWKTRSETFTWLGNVHDLDEWQADAGFSLAFPRGGIFNRPTVIEVWSYDLQEFCLVSVNGEDADLELGEIDYFLHSHAVDHAEETLVNASCERWSPEERIERARHAQPEFDPGASVVADYLGRLR